MNWFSPPPRNLRAELLDLDEAPFEEVKESLGDVRRVNQYLSGYRVLLYHAERFMRKHSGSRPFRILDLATGSADQPIALAVMARKMNFPVTITAMDINRKMLRYAQEEIADFPEISLVQCDILAMPFQENSFDLAVNNLSIHHFSKRDAVVIIKTLYSLGRLGFIVNDLYRSRVAHAAIYLLTRMLTKNRLTRFDAPVSVMNAFTSEEMGQLADEAGIPMFKVYRHFPYRIALVGERETIQ